MKRLYFALSLLTLGLFKTSLAFAVVNLKQVQVKGSSEIELVFDEKVDRSQVHLDYNGDIVQLSLSNVSIYPAKMLPVPDGIFSKVFVYQYSPKVVRCRVTVKGKADEFKERVQLQFNGKSLRIKGQALAVASKKTSDTEEKSIASAVKASAPTVPAVTAVLDEAEEKQLMEKVLKAERQAQEPKKEATAEKEKSEDKAALKSEEKPLFQEKVDFQEKGQLTGGKPYPSPWSAFGKLGLVLAILLGGLFVLKKTKGLPQVKNSKENNGWLEQLKKLATQSFTNEGKMIQVVANHYLGPKKSLVVVKVSGKTLVLGVTSEAISLVTQISDSDQSDQSDLHDEQDEQDDFSDILETKSVKTKSESNEISDSGAAVVGVRSRIKNRLEGLKPL